MATIAVPPGRPDSETMASYFDTEVDLRLVSSSNTAERSESNHLPEGTATVATNTLCGYIKCTGKDYRNLGRWSWMQLQGEVGHRTRIVQAYAVGNNKSKKLGSTYQQSLRHIQTYGLNTTPKDLMIKDLLRQLQIWKRQGD